MHDVCWWSSKANKTITTSCKQQTSYKKSRSKPTGQWTEDRNSSSFCTRWRSWSRRKITSDCTSSARRSTSKTSTTTKSLISRSLTIRIWPSTTTTWTTMPNAPDAIESFTRHLRTPRKWFLMSLISGSHPTLPMFCPTTLGSWPFKPGHQPMRRNSRSSKLTKQSNETKISHVWSTTSCLRKSLHATLMSTTRPVSCFSLMASKTQR